MQNIQKYIIYNIKILELNLAGVVGRVERSGGHMVTTIL
jgi:hypothetical protein